MKFPSITTAEIPKFLPWKWWWMVRDCLGVDFFVHPYQLQRLWWKREWLMIDVRDVPRHFVDDPLVALNLVRCLPTTTCSPPRLLEHYSKSLNLYTSCTRSRKVPKRPFVSVIWNVSPVYSVDVDLIVPHTIFKLFLMFDKITTAGIEYCTDPWFLGCDLGRVNFCRQRRTWFAQGFPDRRFFGLTYHDMGINMISSCGPIRCQSKASCSSRLSTLTM